MDHANAFSEKIKNRKKITGTMLSEISIPNVVRILKAAGFEFIIVDCEHGYFDYSQIAALIAMGTGFDIPVVVRIPAITREFVTKVLDMGAAGLLAPMVNSEEEAKALVSFAKYMPMGKRGISTQRAHTNYNPPPLKEYMGMANDNTILMVQIETRQGLKNLEKIAAVEGIDGIIAGPNDLAADMGIPGDTESEKLIEALERITFQAEKSGKSSGIITSNLCLIRICESKGMNVFSYNSEVGMLMEGAREAIRKYQSQADRIAMPEGIRGGILPKDST
ncbi:MAG: hypothetical protein HDR71_15985 [Lachnospiraceae bacterium]|nr:hypothetical protein [Lachnospiraceae bacterium]